jgi:hypothetical protein
MSAITVKVVETAGEMLTSMLKMYHDKLDKAYLRSDGALSVDLKTTFKPADSGDMEVDVSINFVMDRIKNKFSRTVCEKMDGLFDKPEPAKCAWPTIPSHWWPSIPDMRIDAERMRV